MVSMTGFYRLVAAIWLIPQGWAIQLPSPIFKDVVVIGGGASGAYAASRLRDDYGKSIILIEKQEILGGHVDSYTDPETGITNDYGVQTFVDIANATSFFAKFGVAIQTPVRRTTTTRYIDFTTGSSVDYTTPPTAEQMAAIAKYRDLCEQWEPLMQPGYFEFPEPDNIPADLLLPFKDFVIKHGVEAAMPFFYRITGYSMGTPMEDPTLYAMQTYGAAMARNLLGEQASWVPVSGRNQDLYDAVGESLGEDVLYSSTVINAKRTSSGVLVTVQNSKTKKITVIAARRLLVAIVPTSENLQPFNTDKKENSIFSKFDGTRTHAGIVTNAALPVNYSLTNIPASAAPNNLLEYAKPPMLARFDYMGSDKYFRVQAIGTKDFEAAEAKQLVQETLNRLIDAGQLEEPADRTVNWVAHSDHGASHLRVSAAELKDGFIQKLYSLQGHRSTWWTGGSFSVQFQTTLWAFDDILLEKLVKDMDDIN